MGYLLKLKNEDKDIYKLFYSKPVNPYYIAYNYYSDGHRFMDEEEYEEYNNSKDDPELTGMDSGDNVIYEWGDVTCHNEYEIVSKFVVDCILQGRQIEYDTPVEFELTK